MANNFLFYRSWLDIISEHVEDRQRQNEMIRAIVEYGVNEEPTFPEEVMFLEQAFVQIDSAKEKHNRRSEAGRKGGKAGTGKSKARYGNKNASKTQANDNDNVNENNNDSLHSSLYRVPSEPLAGPRNYRELNAELGDEYE